MAVSVLADLLAPCDKIVYVFCNDSLLSVLLVTLYLAISEGHPLKRTLEYVK